MSSIITVNVLTMSSREIAELTGKSHAHVMRDIRTMMHVLEQNPDLDSVCKTTTYVGANGQSYEQYELDKNTCLTLLLGYDAAARMRVVKRWQELESGKGQIAIPKTLPEALRLAADLAEQKAVAEQERDEAVRTKAWIGSRREATAMATAAAAKREAARLLDELGRNSRHATIVAVENALNIKFPRNAYVSLRRWCKENGAAPEDVIDACYGAVKAWPAGAWLDCYDIDLAELFTRGDVKLLEVA